MTEIGVVPVMLIGTGAMTGRATVAVIAVTGCIKTAGIGTMMFTLASRPSIWVLVIIQAILMVTITAIITAITLGAAIIMVIGH